MAKCAHPLEKHTQVLILWTYIFLGKSTACVLSWCPLIPSFRWTQNGSVVHFILNIPVKHTPCSKVGHRLVRTKVEPFPKKQFVEMNVSNAAPRNSAVQRYRSFANDRFVEVRSRPSSTNTIRHLQINAVLQGNLSY